MLQFRMLWVGLIITFMFFVLEHHIKKHIQKLAFQMKILIMITYYPGGKFLYRIISPNPEN